MVWNRKINTHTKQKTERAIWFEKRLPSLSMMLWKFHVMNLWWKRGLLNVDLFLLVSVIRSYCNCLGMKMIVKENIRKWPTITWCKQCRRWIRRKSSIVDLELFLANFYKIFYNVSLHHHQVIVIIKHTTGAEISSLWNLEFKFKFLISSWWNHFSKWLF